MAYSCHSGKHFVHVLDPKVLHCKHTVMHLSKLSRWGGGGGHRRGISCYKSARGRDFWSFVEFFWPPIMTLEWGICTFLTQDDFPGAGHLNRKTDLSSNPPAFARLPPQQLNLDRCIRYIRDSRINVLLWPHKKVLKYIPQFILYNMLDVLY